jgi:hypothetical protein
MLHQIGSFTCAENDIGDQCRAMNGGGGGGVHLTPESGAGALGGFFIGTAFFSLSFLCECTRFIVRNRSELREGIPPFRPKMEDPPGLSPEVL